MIAGQFGIAPGGPPPAEHWPDGRGYLKQPARFVEGIETIRSEWFHATAPPPAKKSAKPAGPKPPKRRRK
jgi:hypothetical protein